LVSVNLFQFILAVVLHSTALCIQPQIILRKWFVTTVLTLPSFNSISQENSITSERLVNVDILSIQR